MTELEGYLRRIGLTAAPAPDAEGLLTLQRAHRLAIPFENLDIPLGRGISLDPDAVFAKLVTRRRGGYCFEQNQLFLRMLQRIGLKARPLLARVWLMAESVPPLTHTFNLVMLDGRPWVADAGFGGDFILPMPLIANEVAEVPGNVLYRLMEDQRGWVLQRDGGEGWQDQYSFTLAPVEAPDLEMGNHWTSTRPDTRFTILRIVSRALPDGRAGLIGRKLSITHARRTEQRDIADDREYRTVLAKLFGLDLAEDEVSGLGLF